MDDSFTHGPFLERARRRRPSRLILPALLLVAAVTFGAWRLLRRESGAADLPPGLGRGAKVEVQNGTGRRGLARAATRQLRQAGFDVLSFTTIPDSLARTEILVRRGDSTTAVDAIRVLGAGQVRMAIDTLLRIDLTVRLGPDYQPPPGFHP